MSTQKEELITELLQHVEYGFILKKTFFNIPSSKEEKFVGHLDALDNTLKALIFDFRNNKNDHFDKNQIEKQIRPVRNNIFRAVTQIIEILGLLQQKKEIPTVLSTLKTIKEFELPEEITKEELKVDINKTKIAPTL